MATNLEKAYGEISSKSKGHQGILTRDIFMGFFNEAVEKFNLKEDKIKELKAFSYPVEVVESEEKSTQEGSAKEGACIENSEHISTNLTEKDFYDLAELVDSLERQVVTLTGALSKIGTLTGYGNHLKEFKIDKWEPTKKDMNKYK